MNRKSTHFVIRSSLKRWKNVNVFQLTKKNWREMSFIFFPFNFNSVAMIQFIKKFHDNINIWQLRLKYFQWTRKIVKISTKKIEKIIFCYTNLIIFAKFFDFIFRKTAKFDSFRFEDKNCLFGKKVKEDQKSMISRLNLLWNL